MLWHHGQSCSHYWQGELLSVIIDIPRGMGLFADCEECFEPVCYWQNSRSPHALLELPYRNLSIRGFCELCVAIRSEQFGRMKLGPYLPNGKVQGAHA